MSLILVKVKPSLCPCFPQVTMRSLEEYVSLIVDATVSAGISRQVEAFKSGFNQVYTIISSWTFFTIVEWIVN